MSGFEWFLVVTLIVIYIIYSFVQQRLIHWQRELIAAQRRHIAALEAHIELLEGK